MPSLAPHLLLRTDSRASNVSTMLQTAGYMVSKISDDDVLESLAGAAHVDGVVIELPDLASIATVRRIQAKHAQNVAMLVISASAGVIRRALPNTRVLKTTDVGDDLISTIDAALAGHQLKHAG